MISLSLSSSRVCGPMPEIFLSSSNPAVVVPLSVNGAVGYQIGFPISVVRDNLITGNKTVTITATPGVATGTIFAGGSATLTIVNVDTPFSVWAGSQSLTGIDSQPLADPDGDGLSNVLEYALGSQPKQWSSKNSPSLVFDGAQLNFRLTLNPSAAGLSFTVEYTTELGVPWSAAATFSSGGQWMASNGFTVAQNTATGEIDVSRDVSNAAPSHGFMRLKVGY